jgi:hypothetical protein
LPDLIAAAALGHPTPSLLIPAVGVPGAELAAKQPELRQETGVGSSERRAFVGVVTLAV